MIPAVSTLIPSQFCWKACGTRRLGTAATPMNAPHSPAYVPIMLPAWARMLPRRAFHSPRLSVTIVNALSPWIHEKLPGRSCWIQNELNAVKYMSTNQIQPMVRCGRSPRRRRSTLTAPNTMANDAAKACMTMSRFHEWSTTAPIG